ncbi:hypothetical protein BDB00DRAFT_451054 [Zychaea mexicana]|uniref:uncharacterized protein n=1 Tax=Zychaea mexicana TaxID=64656 RepID=UPI0022FDF4E9|nr:uncharacterized protein BDB00DRAFT_451054 [Zychaea mexicana]KAI9498494.1 hypothetical protein BDB00DRAFT_451054 [Zychaea mexicana]
MNLLFQPLPICTLFICHLSFSQPAFIYILFQPQLFLVCTFEYHNKPHFFVCICFSTLSIFFPFFCTPPSCAFKHILYEFPRLFLIVE